MDQTIQINIREWISSNITTKKIYIKKICYSTKSGALGYSVVGYLGPFNEGRSGISRTDRALG